MASKKPPSTPPTYKAEKKRVEILKSATKCFRKTGFHQTSMQEICTETALGPGAVYRYFSSKDAIIEAMAETERSEARAIPAALLEKDDITDVVRIIGKALGVRYKTSADAGMMMEVYAEGLRNKHVGALVNKSEHDWIAALTTLLQAAQQRGQVERTLDARHTALLLTAMWDGMIIRHAYHPAERTLALAGFFDDMIARVLAPDGTVPARTIIKTTAGTSTKRPAKPATKPARPVAKLLPMTASLFDEEPVAADLVEVDERQMSLI